jgi:hypothetical protein
MGKGSKVYLAALSTIILLPLAKSKLNLKNVIRIECILYLIVLLLVEVLGV